MQINWCQTCPNLVTLPEMNKHCGACDWSANICKRKRIWERGFLSFIISRWRDKVVIWDYSINALGIEWELKMYVLAKTVDTFCHLNASSISHWFVKNYKLIKERPWLANFYMNKSRPFLLKLLFDNMA